MLNRSTKIARKFSGAACSLKKDATRAIGPSPRESSKMRSLFGRAEAHFHKEALEPSHHGRTLLTSPFLRVQLVDMEDIRTYTMSSMCRCCIKNVIPIILVDNKWLVISMLYPGFPYGYVILATENCPGADFVARVILEASFRGLRAINTSCWNRTLRYPGSTTVVDDSIVDDR